MVFNLSQKICIMTGIYPPDIGGPATYCFKLKNSLEKLGFQVLIITYKDFNYKDETDTNIIRIERKYSLPLKLLRTILISIFKISKYSIIYAQDPILTAIPAVFLSVIFHKKLIFKIVGDQAWETSRRYKWVDDDINQFQIKHYSFKIRVLKHLQRFLCKFPSKIIVPSNYLRNLVSSWGVNRKKIYVIRNSIEIKKSSELKKGVYNINRELNDIFLLMVGRLENWKRFDLIIKTLPNLENKIKFIIVGEGPEEKNLKQLARDLNVSNRTIFLGKLAHEDLLNLYKEIDILILLSEYEGHSHVLIEGLMKKKNIIATKIGGNPELIRNGKNGILIRNDENELKKAIMRIINNKNILKPKFSHKWTWNNLLKATLKILLTK